MNKLTLLILSFFIISCQNNKISVKSIKKIEVNSSIRALEVVDNSTVWFAGSNGKFGFTLDGGRLWSIDSIKTDSIKPHFRSIAVTSKAVYLLSIASPALLYKSSDFGKSWNIVYREDHSSAFYNTLKFWNENEGIAMGDPTNGCLSVIITRDGGDSWSKLDCSVLPKIKQGEAAFAASNSCIDVYEDNVWIVTGGKYARVYHSADKGKSWKVYGTPINQGDKMTGIFSVKFFNEKEGIICGGDWNKRENRTAAMATTTDGGKTWSLIGSETRPSFRSCVKYIPDTKGQGILATGIPGVSVSLDNGISWQKISDDSYYTCDFGTSSNIVWLAGKGVVATMELK